MDRNLIIEIVIGIGLFFVSKLIFNIFYKDLESKSKFLIPVLLVPIIVVFVNLLYSRDYLLITILFSIISIFIALPSGSYTHATKSGKRDYRYKNNVYNDTTSRMSNFSFLSVILPILFIIIYKINFNENKNINQIKVQNVSSENTKVNNKDNKSETKINEDGRINHNEENEASKLKVTEENTPNEEISTDDMKNEILDNEKIETNNLSEIKEKENTLLPVSNPNAEKSIDRERYIKQADELVKKGHPKVAYGYYNAAQAIQFTEDIDKKMKEIIK